MQKKLSKSYILMYEIATGKIINDYTQLANGETVAFDEEKISLTEYTSLAQVEKFIKDNNLIVPPPQIEIL